MRHPRRPRWQRQDGSVAVEAALTIALILVPLFTFILLFGRYYWYYSAAQKAVHDATLAIANLPLADIRNGRAEELAMRIINWETEDFDATSRSARMPRVDCLYRFPANAVVLSSFNCGTANLTPVMVRTSLTMTVYDPFLSTALASEGQSGQIMIIGEMTMRYVER